MSIKDDVVFISPSRASYDDVLEIFCGNHHGDEEEPLHRFRREVHRCLISDLESLQIDDGQQETHGAGAAVL